MEIQKNENFKTKKKSFLISTIPLIVVIIFATIVLGIIWYSESSNKKYFEKYCEKKSEEQYICSYQDILKDVSLSESRGIVTKIKRYCASRGFEVDEYSSIWCYNFTDKGKGCNDNNSCSSGVCIPLDISCEENCKGRCWNGVNFGTIGSPECIDDKETRTIKDGKIKVGVCWLS